MKTITAIVGIAMLFSSVILVNPTESLAQSMPAMKGHQMSGVLIGKPIRASSGAVLGKVENIVLTDNGCARYVILSGQFAKARGRFFPIPWDQIARVDREALFVDIDPTILVEAPSFQAGRWPDFSQTEWENRVSEFYRTRAHAAAAGQKKEEMKTQHQTPQKQTTEKAISPKEKLKSQNEMRHEQRFGETPAGAGQKEMDMKARQRMESEHGMKQGTTERTMQKPAEKPHQMMMEQGRSGMMGHETGKQGTTERTMQRPAEKPQQMMMQQGHSGMTGHETAPKKESGHGAPAVPQPGNETQVK